MSAVDPKIVAELPPVSILILDYVLRNGRVWQEYVQGFLGEYDPVAGLCAQDDDPVVSLVSQGLLEQLSAPAAEGEEAHPRLQPTAACKELEQAIRGRWEGEVHPHLRELLLQALVKRFAWLPGSPVLKALQQLDRAGFVPERVRPLADVDMPVRIVSNTTTSAVHAVLMTLRAVMPASGERVLICGVKAGFMAAVTAHLVGDKGKVVCLESDPALVDYARANLARYPAVARRVEVFRKDDVTVGHDAGTPWQAIVLNGGLPKIPIEHLHQLDNETGRLLFFMQDPHADAQTCYVVRKNQDIVKNEELSRFNFTPIYGKYGWDTMASLEQQYTQARQNRQGARLEQIRNHAPYPLAKAFMVAYNTYEPASRNDETRQACELLVKYLAVPCLTEFDRLRKQEPQYSEWLSQIGSRPEFGQWLGALRDISRLVKETKVGALIHEDLFGDVRDPRVLDAFQMLEKKTRSPNAGRKAKVSLYEFLDAVVQYRNKIVHHGGITGSEAEHDTPLLLDALYGILAGLAVCNRLELVCFERVEVLAAGCRATAKVLTGCEPHVDQWDFEELGQETPRPGVYLCQGRQLAATLSPWFVYGEGEKGNKNLFIYNGPNEYLTYHDKDHYPPQTVQQALERLLSKHKIVAKPVSERALAQELLDELMVMIVADGKITRDELEHLTASMLKHGLARTSEEAAEHIHRLVEQKHPGVYFAES